MHVYQKNLTISYGIFSTPKFSRISKKNNKSVSLLYKAIISVRGLFAPTGHSFQDTDIWIILFDPKY